MATVDLLTGQHIERESRQWIPLTNSELQGARRLAWRHLPYADAEEVVAELLEAELQAAAEAGRPGHIRREHLTPVWIKLTCLDYRTGKLARRLAELDSEDSEEIELLAADELPPEEEAEEIGASSLYRQAAEVARRLCLVADPPVIYCLAQGLSSEPAAKVAESWGVSLRTWQKAAGAGAREIRASYPDPIELVQRLTDLGVAWRRTPLAERALGARLPDDPGSRHRTAAQSAREANVLLAREQLPGRKPEASKANEDFSRMLKPPIEWQPPRDPAPVDLLPVLRAVLRKREAKEAPKSGARAHRAAPGVRTRGKLSSVAEIEEMHGWGHIEEGATCDLAPGCLISNRTPTRGRRSLAEIEATWAKEAEATAQREARAKAAREAARKSRKGKAAKAPNRPPAAVLQAEEGHRRPITRRQVWRLVFTPPHKRPGALIPCSLDVAARGEIERESEEAFPMVEDLIARAAD